MSFLPNPAIPPAGPRIIVNIPLIGSRCQSFFGRRVEPESGRKFADKHLSFGANAMLPGGSQVCINVPEMERSAAMLFAGRQVAAVEDAP
jgi:hypothetical protein